MSSADDVDEAPPPDASRRRLPRRRLALGVLLTVTVLLTAFVVERHRSSTASATPVEGSNYLVRTGDTITSVADLHAVDRDDLMDAHDLTLENSLAPGERLVVPDPPRGEPPAELTADTNKLRYAAAFEAAEARHDLPPGLLKALAWQESEWVNATVGEDGEQGLGQLHPEVIVSPVRTR
ncbi:MAG: LysM peptidoglycan-binding domain-containing protein [Actinomycetota bacterium]